MLRILDALSNALFSIGLKGIDIRVDGGLAQWYISTAVKIEVEKVKVQADVKIGVTNYAQYNVDVGGKITINDRFTISPIIKLKSDKFDSDSLKIEIKY